MEIIDWILSGGLLTILVVQIFTLKGMRDRMFRRPRVLPPPPKDVNVELYQGDR